MSTVRLSSVALVVSIAATPAACGTPSTLTPLHGKLDVRGTEAHSGEVVFEIPAELKLDCRTLAGSGLYTSQRRLHLLFTPRELTQETPLQQFAIAIGDYKGPRPRLRFRPLVRL